MKTIIWIYNRNPIIITRSPLNVVHAGLDIVRSDVKAQSLFLGTADVTSADIHISADTAEMIEQIFAASSTAIEILDDLLIYEHIDSGNWMLLLCSSVQYVNPPR